MATRRLLAAASVTVVAFLLYRATLLPGVDFGDTGSFQFIVGLPFISPRDGYPLYFAIGHLFLALAHGEPARTLNLLSAVEGALACGGLVWVAAELSGSLGAGIGAALLFTGSYTFWSQAIIAEVYSLHMLFVMLTLIALLRWQQRPTLARLSTFFAVYALGFGNHLSMILLMPAYTAFILTASPGGWRSLFTWRVALLAVFFAVAGSLQYAWNLRTLWLLPQPPADLTGALQRFWFDVTKSDWRDTMVMHVPRSMLADHAAMYWFDVRQQFGVAGILLALIGFLATAFKDWRRALLIGLMYAANVAFAYSYSVGDTHVFYLPSHAAAALLVAPGIVFAGQRLARSHLLAVSLLVAYGVTRMYMDYPALDRSNDRRPAVVLSAMTSGVDDAHDILVTDLNWQVQNGLSYYARITRPDIGWTRAPDVLLYAPSLVADNFAIGRQVALTEQARLQFESAYGPLLPTRSDSRVSAPTLEAAIDDLASGIRYVFCILKPTSDTPLDWNDVRRSLTALASPAAAQLPAEDYVVIAGVVGKPPAAVFSANTPFRRTIGIDGVDVQVRMDSWLTADTIRRMGFGHVIVGRRHTLIVERGASFVAFDATGQPTRTAYAGNIFAPEARYVITK